jgi:hypothetical protein
VRGRGVEKGLIKYRELGRLRYELGTVDLNQEAI